MTQNLSLLTALGAKMDYLNQRQRVVAQNIANADTPNYRPKDLVPTDFDQILKGITKSNGVHIETTDGQHMPPPNDIADPKSRKSKDTYEVAPAGNAVIVEEQLIKSNETVMDYNLMTSLYQKHMGMIRTAIGGGQ